MTRLLAILTYPGISDSFLTDFQIFRGGFKRVSLLTYMKCEEIYKFHVTIGMGELLCITLIMEILFQRKLLMFPISFFLPRTFHLAKVWVFRKLQN